jgi:hypothetical protein
MNNVSMQIIEGTWKEIIIVLGIFSLITGSIIILKMFKILN